MKDFRSEREYSNWHASVEIRRPQHIAPGKGYRVNFWRRLVRSILGAMT